MTQPARVDEPQRFDRHQTLNQAYDQIQDLTEPRHISERYDDDNHGTRRHVHTLPSLIEALKAAVEPGGDNGQASGGRSFESRPAARLDPIVVLRDIDTIVRKRCAELGLQRATTVGYLLALSGALSGLGDGQLRLIGSEISRVHAAARVATGYDDPPQSINEQCPYCFNPNSLMWSRQEAEFRAWCSRCAKSWNNDTIGILRDMLDANRTQETMAADAK